MSPSQAASTDLPSTAKISSQKFVNGSLPAPANLSAEAISKNVIDWTHKIPGYHVWPNPWPRQFLHSKDKSPAPATLPAKRWDWALFLWNSSIISVLQRPECKQTHHIDMLQGLNCSSKYSTLHTISKMAPPMRREIVQMLLHMLYKRELYTF